MGSRGKNCPKLCDVIYELTNPIHYIRLWKLNINESSLLNSHLASFGLTWEIGSFNSSAKSSTVLLPAEMIPTDLAIVLAVTGWSPIFKKDKLEIMYQFV